MKQSWREFLYFFFVQFLSYGALCWNYRAIAQARMAHIVASDICCAAVTFSLIKHVAAAKSRWAGVGYVLGGVAGSVVSVWLTRDLFGK